VYGAGNFSKILNIFAESKQNPKNKSPGGYFDEKISRNSRYTLPLSNADTDHNRQSTIFSDAHNLAKMMEIKFFHTINQDLLGYTYQ
jgi:hypothetical protein